MGLLIYLVIHFAIGWFSAKALYRQAWKDFDDGPEGTVTGIIWMVFFTGPLGFIVALLIAGGEMAKMLRLNRIPRPKGGITAKFFGEA